MRVTPAVRTTEPLVHRDASRTLCDMCEIALRNRVRIGLIGLHPIGTYGQPVDVPAYPLLFGQMPVETMIQTAHGTAHITILA